MKITELREMSDEQLQLTLHETAESPVPSADAGADRTARRAERVAAPSSPGGADQDDPARAGIEGRVPVAIVANQESWSAMPKRVAVGVVASDKMAKTRRVEIPRLVRHAKYGKYHPPYDGVPRA